MQKELTVTSNNQTVKGTWGQATNPFDGVVPLVIFATIEDDVKKTEIYTNFLNNSGILTFAFKAKDIDEAKKFFRASFEELRGEDAVASEYIVFAGFGDAGRAAALTASEIGNSVRGLFLMAPTFVPEDILKVEKYNGEVAILAGTEDDDVNLDNLETVASRMPHAEVLQVRGGKHVYGEREVDRAQMLLRTFVMTALNK